MIHSDCHDRCALVAGAIAACSAGYYVLCLWSAAAFLRERKAAEGARPTPVSATGFDFEAA